MEIVNLKPYLPKDFNLDSIVYSNVHNEGNNKKSIFLYDTEPGKKIYIQSPELVNIISLNKKTKYYELNLPLYGKKKKHISSFVEFIQKLDNKIMSDAKLNKNTWFDESNTNVRYRSLIKNIHNDYIDTVEFKSGMFENGIIKLKINEATCVSLNDKIIKPDELKINHDIKTIFQIYAIWISNSLFGLYLKPVKINQKLKIVEQIDFILSDSENDTVYNTDIENLSDEQDNDSESESEKQENNSDDEKNNSDDEEDNSDDEENNSNDEENNSDDEENNSDDEENNSDDVGHSSTSKHYMNNVNIVNIGNLNDNLNNIFKLKKNNSNNSNNSNNIFKLKKNNSNNSNNLDNLVDSNSSSSIESLSINF
jgi:hypothetical protein